MPPPPLNGSRPILQIRSTYYVLRDGQVSVRRVGDRLDIPLQQQPVIVKSVPYDFTLDHVNNFLECTRTRQRPNGDVLIGHRSAQASHLGNIAYVEKRRIDFDPVREEILPF